MRNLSSQGSILSLSGSTSIRLPLLVVASCLLILQALHSIFFTSPDKHNIVPESSTFHLVQNQNPSVIQDGSSFLPLSEAQKLCQPHDMDPFPAREHHRKVYDLFLIGTEMDWAEIRLNELSPHVDYFVILESRTTFSNQPKPLHFKENWSKFSKFAPQIIYHVLEDDAIQDEGAWDREYYQRNALMDQVFPRLLGVQAPNYGDVILVSDVDEIPRPETITTLRNCDIPQHVTINSRWYLYSFQWHAEGDDWFHPQATFWQGFENTPRPDFIRMASPEVILNNASWSCTTCFKRVGQIVNKIRSFSHQEYNQDQFTDPAEIVRRVRNGIDVFDRDEIQYEKVVGNLDVPKYLKQNKDKFAYLVDRDPPDANFIDWDAEKGSFKRPV